MQDNFARAQPLGQALVCKIPLLARALSLKAEQPLGQARDDRVSCIQGFPLVMRSRKVDFPLATRARKRQLCLYRYVSRMNRTENFISQIFRSFFSGKHFSPRFMLPSSL